jgi:hypothetical protein
LLWFEPASPGNRIILIADNVILDDVYRGPCGKAAHDNQAIDTRSRFEKPSNIAGLALAYASD